MATRGRTTFKKRQKELARKEKQRLKAERRAQRKLTPRDEGEAVAEDVTFSAELEPEGGPQVS